MKFNRSQQRKTSVLVAVVIGLSAIIPTTTYGAINDSNQSLGGSGNSTTAVSGYTWSGGQQFLRLSLFWAPRSTSIGSLGVGGVDQYGFDWDSPYVTQIADRAIDVSRSALTPGSIGKYTNFASAYSHTQNGYENDMDTHGNYSTFLLDGIPALLSFTGAVTPTNISVHKAYFQNESTLMPILNIFSTGVTYDEFIGGVKYDKQGKKQYGCYLLVVEPGIYAGNNGSMSAYTLRDAIALGTSGGFFSNSPSTVQTIGNSLNLDQDTYHPKMGLKRTDEWIASLPDSNNTGLNGSALVSQMKAMYGVGTFHYASEAEAQLPAIHYYYAITPADIQTYNAQTSGEQIEYVLDEDGYTIKLYWKDSNRLVKTSEFLNDENLSYLFQRGADYFETYDVGGNEYRPEDKMTLPMTFNYDGVSGSKSVNFSAKAGFVSNTQNLDGYVQKLDGDYRTSFYNLEDNGNYGTTEPSSKVLAHLGEVAYEEADNDFDAVLRNWAKTTGLASITGWNASLANATSGISSSVTGRVLNNEEGSLVFSFGNSVGELQPFVLYTNLDLTCETIYEPGDQDLEIVQRECDQQTTVTIVYFQSESSKTPLATEIYDISKDTGWTIPAESVKNDVTYQLSEWAIVEDRDYLGESEFFIDESNIRPEYTEDVWSFVQDAVVSNNDGEKRSGGGSGYISSAEWNYKLTNGTYQDRELFIKYTLDDTTNVTKQYYMSSTDTTPANIQTEVIGRNDDYYVVDEGGYTMEEWIIVTDETNGVPEDYPNWVIVREYENSSGTGTGTITGEKWSTPEDQELFIKYVIEPEEANGTLLLSEKRISRAYDLTDASADPLGVTFTIPKIGSNEDLFENDLRLVAGITNGLDGLVVGTTIPFRAYEMDNLVITSATGSEEKEVVPINVGFSVWRGEDKPTLAEYKYNEGETIPYVMSLIGEEQIGIENVSERGEYYEKPFSLELAGVDYVDSALARWTSVYDEPTALIDTAILETRAEVEEKFEEQLKVIEEEVIAYSEILIKQIEAKAEVSKAESAEEEAYDTWQEAVSGHDIDSDDHGYTETIKTPYTVEEEYRYYYVVGTDDDGNDIEEWEYRTRTVTKYDITYERRWLNPCLCDTTKEAYNDAVAYRKEKEAELTSITSELTSAFLRINSEITKLDTILEPFGTVKPSLEADIAQYLFFTITESDEYQKYEVLKGKKDYDINVKVEVELGTQNQGLELVADGQVNNPTSGTVTSSMGFNITPDLTDYISFYPYVEMLYDTTVGYKNQAVYMLGGHNSDMLLQDYFEVAIITKEYNSMTPTGLLLDSYQWSTHAGSVALAGGQLNTVLPGGAIYSLTTPEKTESGEEGNRTLVRVDTWLSYIPEDNYDAVYSYNEENHTLQSGKFEEVKKAVYEIMASLNSLDVYQYVEGAVVIPGERVVNNQPVSGDAKYQLDKGEVDGTADIPDAVNEPNANDADLDITKFTEEAWIHYRVFSEVDGTVYVAKGNNDEETRNPDNVIAYATKGQGIEGFYGFSEEVTEEIQELDSRTKLITNYLSAIDRGLGNDTTIYESNWYNEAFDGICAVKVSYEMELGFKDNDAATALRTAVLDPNLQPVREGQADLYTQSVSSYFQTNSRTNNHIGQVDGYLTEINGKSIILDLTTIYKSRDFLIPNASVMDLY